MRAPAVLVPTLAVAALASGCGSDRERPPPAEQQVRRVLTSFATAAERRDYGRICTEILAPRLLAGLREIGLPCELALQKSLGAVREPRLTVGAVTVDGRTATAEVRTSAAGQRPSSDTVRLDRIQGSWRVSDLSGGAAPAPTVTPEATVPDGDAG